jgi:hypothetical protein
MTDPNDFIDTVVFPLSGITLHKGLTKREYFAAMALQGIIAAHNIYENGIDNEVNAKTAVNAADELIKTLNQ